ncbi:PEP-CTERM sorting domain-containing protein [Duganella aquatilis]|uniref:PEP-CTERM sorting domain-containing protein n=1 Tax=Duganella aquatilis TaxID=2666082 RepID=UPI001E507C15|nr:PEP-CTERM sorting domain-containing protein [Duganella aquatilis]
MLTLQRFACLGAIAAAITTSCPSAVAVPILEAPPHWQAERAKPPAPGMSNCVGQPAGATRPPTAWNGSGDAPLSASAKRALHGGGRNDLDSYKGRCRLVDADHDSSEPLNDGVDPEQLLKLLDEMDAMNRTLSEDEEQSLLGSRIHIAVDSTDNELHAYIGAGGSRLDLGQLSRLDLENLPEGDDLAPRYDASERTGRAEKQLNRMGQANPVVLAAAIPEPSTYAMLLAGLGMLALMRRRKDGA